MTPAVATLLDLPFPSPGGSVELFLDLYTGGQPLIPAAAFMLASGGKPPLLPQGLHLLNVSGKCLEGRAFNAYVERLRAAVTSAIQPEEVSTLHLHHLAFGASPALLRALPVARRIALVHGTDLLYASMYPDQRDVLQHCARAVDTIVVPTKAMADRLLALAPGTTRRKIELIPWGIPDQLLSSAASPRPRRTDHLRLLYAGRLASEKGVEALVDSLTATPATELSIAAPPAQFHALAPLLHRLGVHVHYLGWLRRPQLWKAFADHDVLVMPSTTFEAMGLVALEAQACGLPVLYQPVPGLNETLASTGMATDFSTPATLTRDLTRLRTTSGLLVALRTAGRANAARYPLSATATALTDLGRQLN
ncbi:glycosyltransferase family 4 protein [Streptomyces sp. NPDC049040]|uniref:glycosyltransferase family 4 protein n=1 Tax=Streptomyces sp. NPDC049040 TaxID=3365593 RepID=UPI00370FE238